ncbi:hypothetical protein [Modestobacter marinus]|uniref:hypothetical protein n=1 Tax=Modestobacter marinus TaxID=477641 RepID=UPI00201ACF04|nr:hypothetical protein [Modestobacter marinus]
MDPLEQDLVDELTGGAGGDAEGEQPRWHRRRVRQGLTAVAAVVVAVGVPVASGWLSSSPSAADVAGPGPTTAAPAPTSTAPALPTDRPVTADAGDAVLTGGAADAYGKDPQPTPTDADSLARRAAVQADLGRLEARLGAPVLLTSPTDWDRWLPDSKPYPGADTADDLSTCPVLSDGLATSLGPQMSYWVGTLPSGPVGCTWAPVPLQYDTIEYPFTVSVGFLGDGTTPEELAGSAVSVAGDQPTGCPQAVLPGGGVLYECWSTQGVTDVWLAVPDVRGAGVWVVNGTARDDSPVSAVDAFTAVLDGVVRNYG